MNQSFFPNQNSDLLAWLNNYKTKLTVHATALGLTAAQVTQEKAWCDAMIAAINLIEIKKQELKSAVSGRETAMQTQIGALRIEIARHKLAAGYTVAIGEDLGVVGTHVAFDPAAYKAKITAEIFGGFVRIKFVKKGADGIDLYHRKKGDATWLFLARDTKSPYDDHIVLETQNQPEHWEYRAFGVLDDAEIGQPSDIVEVVFGG